MFGFGYAGKDFNLGEEICLTTVAQLTTYHYELVKAQDIAQDTKWFTWKLNESLQLIF